MYKYIITWCLATLVQVECPNQVDEFGRISTTSCLVFHSKTVRDCSYIKTFNDSEKAKNFYNKALIESKINNLNLLKSDISNVKIDSIKIIKL